MKSFILSLTLALSLSAQANLVSQGAQSLIEVITKKSNVETLLERREIFAAGSESLETISSDFELALKAFGIRGSKGTQVKLLKAIKGITPANEEDKKVLESITATLKKSVGELSDSDIAKAHDELLYLASRYGKKGSVMLVCLDCTAGTTITSKGFKYTFEELNDSKSKSIIKQLRTLGPNGVSKVIRDEMSLAKYGSYESISGSALNADQELAFALFLKLGKEGNGQQKAYVDAVERVLGKSNDGSTNFFNSGFSHNLHMFFQENHEASFVKNYTKFLNDIADAKEAEGLSSKEAYEKILRSKAMTDKDGDGVLEEDAVLMKKVNQLLGRCPMFK